VIFLSGFASCPDLTLTLTLSHQEGGYGNSQKAALLVMLYWLRKTRGAENAATLTWGHAAVQNLAQYFTKGAYPYESDGRKSTGMVLVRRHILQSFFKLCQPYFGNPVMKKFFGDFVDAMALADYSSFDPTLDAVQELYGCLVMMANKGPGRGRCINYAADSWKTEEKWSCPNAVARRACVIAAVMVQVQAPGQKLPQKNAMSLVEYGRYKKYHRRWRNNDLAIRDAFVLGGGTMPYDAQGRPPAKKRTKVQLLRGEPPRLEAGALLLTLEIPDLTDSEDAEDAEDAAGDD